MTPWTVAYLGFFLHGILEPKNTGVRFQEVDPKNDLVYLLTMNINSLSSKAEIFDLAFLKENRKFIFQNY